MPGVGKNKWQEVHERRSGRFWKDREAFEVKLSMWKGLKDRAVNRSRRSKGFMSRPDMQLSCIRSCTLLGGTTDLIWKGCSNKSARPSDSCSNK